MNIAIVAGEHSGDNLGASLIQSLKMHYPDAKFFGMGGEYMQAQGLESLAPMEKLSIMGLVEVLPKVPELYFLRKRLVSQFIERGIDIFIGIDAPDFNLGLAKLLKEKHIKTVHYVSPSVWAWRQNRIIKIKQSVDLMITLFPFEQDFYQKHKQLSVCVGHPLANTYAVDKTEQDIINARERLNLLNKPTVALMPGSRVGEVSKLLDDFITVAKQVASHIEDVQFIVSIANDKVETFIREHPLADLNLTLVKGNSEDVMRASDVLLIASGTATFEGLLCKTPMVAAYKVNGLTYFIAMKLVKTPFFTLPNILANEALVPEYIQHYDTKDLANDILLRLNSTDLRASVVGKFDAIHRQLQLGGSDKAALAVFDLLGEA